MEATTKITETVLEILKSGNFVTKDSVYTIQSVAPERLDMDFFSNRHRYRQKFVRALVESYLAELEAEEKNVEEKEDEIEDVIRRGEFDGSGDRLICRLSYNRKVTITKFGRTTLVSMRQYINKDGKERPLPKGINLSKEQWASLKKNISAIEKAIKEMESRLN